MENKLKSNKIKFCEHLGCTDFALREFGFNHQYCAKHQPVKCFFPLCTKFQINHVGLCQAHFAIATRLIEIQATTWHELLRLNKIRALP